MASTNQIAKSLLELEHCPSDSLRQMLLKGLPHAFGGCRHAYQMEYSKLLRKCIDEEQSHQQQAQEKCAVEATEMKGKLEEAQAELAAATERVQAAKAVVEEKAASLSLKQQASKAEELLHEDAKAETDAAVLEHQKLEELKAEVDTVANGPLQMLLNGGWEDADGCEDFVSAVFEYLKALDCEPPLLAALPKALGQRPAERGMFDKMTVEEVVRIVDAKVVSMASAVEQDDEKMVDFNATSLGAWAIWDLACDVEKAAFKAHEESQEELQVKTTEQNSVEASVAGWNAALEKASAAKAVVDFKVQEIQSSLGELERLETIEEHEDKENADVPAPSPKKRKIDEADTEIQVEPVCIAAQ